jgi:alkyl hydroperoxide reductase subunit AhpC
VTEKDLLGHWSLLFFYPADFTFVCPTELKELGEMYPSVPERRAARSIPSARIRILSTRPGRTCLRRSARMPYPMLADPAGVLARQYGVLDEAAGQAYRGAFLLNPESEASSSMRSTTWASAATRRNSCASCRRRSFVAEHGDQVCPAKWHPGEATLTPSLELVGACCEGRGHVGEYGGAGAV